MIAKIAKPKVDLWLDSGAFSAWKRGVEIDLKEYIAYIKANAHLLHSYVNLDVIPGKPNQRRTQAQVDAAAKRSYANQQTMKRAGLTPIPVFHQGEDFSWLKRYMDDGEPYIGISPSGDLPVAQTRPWLDLAFTHVTDAKGNPLVKTHGFGVASFDLLKRYPWYTCDATSWALAAAYGSIYVPIYRNGKPDYALSPVKLTVSEAERKGGALPSDHYLRYGPAMKARVIDFLENEVGVDVKDAAKDYEVRARAIVFFMKKFEAAIPERPFAYRVRGFQ